MSAMIRRFEQLRLTFIYDKPYNGGMSTVITDKEVKSFLSANLRRILTERGLSGRWLMKELKLKEGTFYPMYNGEVVPGVAVTARMAEVLEITLDELLRNPAENGDSPRKRRKYPKIA